MLTVLHNLKTLTLWQKGLLVAVVLVAAGATYGGYARSNEATAAAIGKNQQVIPVQYGNLTIKVSTSGTLAFPNRETLTFGSPGIVDALAVKEGQRVQKGQVIAKLDQTALVSLERAVAKAKLDLQQAEKARDDEKALPDAKQLAQNETNVANARRELQKAREALEDARDPYTPQEIRIKEHAVASDKVALQGAQKALVDFRQDHAYRLAQARQSKAEAESALNQAQEALANLAADHTRRLAQARDGKARAEVALGQAEEALTRFTMDYDQRLAQARQASAGAVGVLKDAEMALEQFKRANDRRLEPLRQARDVAEADLKAVRDNISHLKSVIEAGLQGVDFHLQGLELSAGFIQEYLEDLRKTLAERERLEAAVEVAKASLAKARQDLAGLELGPDLLQLQQLRTAVEVAQANLMVAKKALADVKSEGDPREVALHQEKLAIAQMELKAAYAAQATLKPDAGPKDMVSLLARVRAARSTLEAAENALAAVKVGADPVQLALQKARVSASQSSLERVEDELAELESGPDPLELGLKERQVALAQATLAQHQEDLAELLRGPDSLEVALLEKQVTLAQATLAQAEEDLAELRKGPDPLTLALREAEVTVAQRSLEDSLTRLTNATLRAPITGFVSLVGVKERDEVTAQTTVAEIVDSAVVEVDGLVDEVDILGVREGLAAVVKVDALPRQSLEGVVSEIAPKGRSQQGVVSYPIRIQVKVPDGLRLNEGLTAAASIILREDKNVLLVPQQALYGSFDQPVVKVMNHNGLVEERRVVLGNGDGFWTAVLQGLEQNDRVLMETRSATTTPANLRQFQSGIPGGGFSGGGGFQGSGRSGQSGQPRR